MLKFKRSSLHYRFVRKFWSHPSTSLCKYVWQFIFSVIGAITCILMAAMITFIFVLVPIGHILTAAGIYDFGVEWKDALLPYIVWSCIMATGVGALIVRGIREYKWRNRHKVKPEKEPNLFVEFVKAKKEKVCPIIKFED